MYFAKRLLIYQYGKEEWVLFNTLTGAVDVMDREGYNKFQRIKKNDFSGIDPQFIKVLKKRGYLFEREEEEENLLNRMLKEYERKFSYAPIKALICPTFACNLRCTYCFQGNLRQRVPANLGRKEIILLFRALDEIVRRRGAPGAQVEISGGEPLLLRNYELIDFILNCVSRRKYPVGIVTNGVNLSKFWPLLKKYRASIGNMQITIDGPAPIHNKRRKFVNGSGTFERIVKGIDLVLDLEIPVVMRVNVDLENVDFLPELSEFIKSKGWNKKEYYRARLARVENHTGNKDYNSEYTLTQRIETLTERYPLMRETFADSRISRTLGQIAKIKDKAYEKYKPNFYYCEATSTGLYTFGADGLLYPCGEAAGNPSFSVGRFLPELKIDEEKFSYWQGQSIVDIPECRKCPIALLCGGGCRYEALRIDEKSQRAICDNRKREVEKYIKLWVREWFNNRK